MHQWIKNLERRKFTSGRYSQSYQDELLEIIFKNTGTRNPTPFCVEFGFDSKNLIEGTRPNVSRLILEHNWGSILLDGDNENDAIDLHKHFLKPSNICAIFEKYNVPKEPEYVSIDVDSTDLWLFEALIKEYRAMVFSVEYNSHFPIDAAITFPDDGNEYWQGDRGYGASLKALNIVANNHGYSLLWVVPGFDAFFIRNDLIDDRSRETSFPFESWRAHSHYRLHPPLKDPSRLGIFIDYEVYLSTSGDLDASRKAARSVCRRYLLDSFPQIVTRKARQLIKKVIT